MTKTNDKTQTLPDTKQDASAILTVSPMDAKIVLLTLVEGGTITPEDVTAALQKKDTAIEALQNDIKAFQQRCEAFGVPFNGHVTEPVSNDEPGTRVTARKRGKSTLAGQQLQGRLLSSLRQLNGTQKRQVQKAMKEAAKRGEPKRDAGLTFIQKNFPNIAANWH